MNDEFFKRRVGYGISVRRRHETGNSCRTWEIVPVIRDRQTREIVENTIRKLDTIPEPECHRFIADTKQRFIQKRDNSIRRRLAEAKAQARAEKPHPKKNSQTGNGHNCFQSGKRGFPPLKEGATIHHFGKWCIAPCREAPCGQQMISVDFQSAPIITGDATLPCAGLRQLPLCGLAARNYLALQVVSI